MAPTLRRLNLVVAACDNMGIGIEGKLPWRLKQDMAMFKKITTTTQSAEKRNVVMMGKNTWLSIPPKLRPLSGRINVVLSTQMTDAPQGAVLSRNFDEAMKQVETMSNEIEGLFVIGGASIYRAAIESKYPCRIYFTRVDGEFKCDTYFPHIDSKVFQKVDNPMDVPNGTFEDNGIKYSFEVYDKRNSEI